MPEPPIYEIRVQGHLLERYQRWFDGMEMELLPNGETRLTGPLDQPALHGILTRIRDLNLPLIEVRRVKERE